MFLGAGRGDVREDLRGVVQQPEAVRRPRNDERGADHVLLVDERGVGAQVEARIRGGIAVVAQYEEMILRNHDVEGHVGGRRARVEVGLVQRGAVDADPARGIAAGHVVPAHADHAFHEGLLGGIRDDAHELECIPHNAPAALR